MKFKVLGGYVKKCEEGKRWKTSATLYLQKDFPQYDDILDSAGISVRSVVCDGAILPSKLPDMIGKTYIVSTNNNFATDFYEVK